MKGPTHLLVALVVWASSAAPALAQVSPAPRGNDTATAAVQAAGPVPAQRLQPPGLPHFGTISARLYRGAQPQDRGFAELQKLGVDIVVNLRHERDDIARERVLVEARGMRYVSLPWRGSQDPDTRQVAEFLELIRDNPDRRIFVHCQRGAERTGVMVACYRIAMERWTPEQALDEMKAFRFRGWRFGHLSRFVRAFPARLLSDPLLTALGISR